MTNAEILAHLEKHYLKQIAEREKDRQYYINKGQLDRLPAVEKRVDDIRARLEEARAKYGKE